MNSAASPTPPYFKAAASQFWLGYGRLAICAGVLALLHLAVPFGSAHADTPDSYKNCRKPSYRFSPGGTTTVPLTIRRNAVCTFRFWTGGAIYAQRVTVQPRLGDYRISNSTFGAYRSRGGTGSDYFEVKVDWETRAARVSTTLRVNVTVVDQIN